MKLKGMLRRILKREVTKTESGLSPAEIEQVELGNIILRQEIEYGKRMSEMYRKLGEEESSYVG